MKKYENISRKEIYDRTMNMLSSTSPEITDPDWLVRNRAEYRLANKKDMKLDKTSERIGE